MEKIGFKETSRYRAARRPSAIDLVFRRMSKLASESNQDMRVLFNLTEEQADRIVDILISSDTDLRIHRGDCVGEVECVGCLIAQLREELDDQWRAYVESWNAQADTAQGHPDPGCPECKGTGWYGDNRPGRKGNREFQKCECREETGDE